MTRRRKCIYTAGCERRVTRGQWCAYHWHFTLLCGCHYGHRVR